MSSCRKPVTQQIRKERRERAEERTKEYNEKYPTPQAKLAALPATGSTKQRARLTALIANKGSAQPAPEKVEVGLEDLLARNKENMKSLEKGQDQ